MDTPLPTSASNSEDLTSPFSWFLLFISHIGGSEQLGREGVSIILKGLASSSAAAHHFWRKIAWHILINPNATGMVQDDVTCIIRSCTANLPSLMVVNSWYVLEGMWLGLCSPRDGLIPIAILKPAA